MPVNGDTTTNSVAMSSGDKLTSLSSSAGVGGEEADYGEAFQPHVDTKQIQVPTETASPGEEKNFVSGG